MDLLILCLWNLILIASCSDKIKELHTLKEIEDFKRFPGTNGIFFYARNEKKEGKIKSRTLNLMKNSQILMEENEQVYARFAKVNCFTFKKDAANISECLLKKRIFSLYGEHGIEQQFAIAELHSHEAFESKVVTFAHGDKIRIAQNKDDLEYELNEVRGKKDILFLYVDALGSHDHYRFVSFALTHLEKYHYLISTQSSFASELFKTKITSKAALWYMRCKQLAMSSNDQCKHRRYLGKEIPYETALEEFVKTLDKPFIDHMKEDGSLHFQSAEQHVVYAFVDSKEQAKEKEQMLEAAILDTVCTDYMLRGVVVNVKTLKDYTSRFGIVSENVVPTFAIHLVDNDYNGKIMEKDYYTAHARVVKNTIQMRRGEMIDKSGEVKVLDYFPPDKDIDLKSVIEFLDSSINRKRSYAKEIADVYHIDQTKLVSWKNVPNEIPQLIAACSRDKEFESACTKFGIAYRHLVRTIQMYNSVDMDFSYIDFTGKPKSAELNVVPCVKYSASGVETTFQVKDTEDLYADMLKWVNVILKTDMKALPLSSCDFVKLSAKSRDKFAKTHYDSIDHLENDEIAREARKNSETRLFYEDDIPKVTDETFAKVLNDNKMLVVLFFMNFDDKSFMLQPIFSKVNNLSASNLPSVKFVKVDCYQQYSTCKSQEVVSYPIIRIYSDGEKLIDYNGLLDENSLYSAIQLYQIPPLMKLSEETLTQYQNGEYKDMSNVKINFFGRFTQENQQEFKDFKQEAISNYGRHLFTYIIGADPKHADENLPRVTAYFLHDDFRASIVMEEAFSTDALKRFIMQANVPLMDELNVSNFPAFKALNVPFVLLFTTNHHGNDMKYKGMRALAAKYNNRSILFAWMDLQKQSTKIIRHSYIGVNMKSSNNIVLVNHTNGLVYLYGEDKSSVQEYVSGIEQWVKACQRRDVKATSHLNKREWKPLHEGFNFLYYEDNNIGGVHGKSFEEAFGESEDYLENSHQMSEDQNQMLEDEMSYYQPRHEEL